ncbi:uncharacterized protein LOC116845118 isoform X2 [Odontomachus brunneus]|uniref:uncharacterized protein LOC116845118 isoform X2 n=1 Tax=Odontomachus brunneus TaxID=486640 RepID=UPI0013F2378A|nr:uncharacterized protein LOC116845118 isoform X2 [Odontomachus brunneus]
MDVFELLLYHTKNDMFVNSFTAVNTFDVFVKSTFVPNWRDFDSHQASGNLLSLKLICYVTLYDTMLCRTEKPVLESPSNLYSTSVSSSNSNDRRIRRNSFDQPGTPFEIHFDYSGVVSYAVEKDDVESMRMNNVYRMIANQMNVGAYNIYDHSDFYPIMERSTVGYCPTNFTTTRYPSSKKKILSKTLTPFFLEMFDKHGSVLISKYRNIDECTELSHYSFAVRYWHELVPALSVTEHVKKSESFITMDKDTLESTTENSFDFLDKNGKRIGSVVEAIVLKLTSVDIKSKHGEFDNNLAYRLDVINNDKI